MDLHIKKTDPFDFDNSYARLPERFYEFIRPTPVAEPTLIKLNRPLAQHLGLDPEFLASPAGIKIFAGNNVPEGSEPLAMAYAGQQFGGWVPQLGDGRAILLGEIIDVEGVRRDIQLKGAGRTRYSRSGDGRAWIGPVLREYLVSEAMASLNIPTTRALAAVLTGEPVFREQTYPGAVITRVASSHIRVGTFQYFAARQDIQALQVLADHVINRHYPVALEAENRYLNLFENVVTQQAILIAKWMAVGFIHGVMNTDNVLISGETIDYGPCAFMDSYNPSTVFSSIDHMGRYAYENQPKIALWNLASLASSLIPIIDTDEDKAVKELEKALNAFNQQYEKAWASSLRGKLGLVEEQSGDIALAYELLKLMAVNEADFTLTFRRLSNLSGNGVRDNSETDGLLGSLFNEAETLNNWLVKWRRRLAIEKRDDHTRQAAMRAVNPAYIPRNHRIEQVILAALDGDYKPFEVLTKILAAPFNDQEQYSNYQLPPLPEEEIRQTFCGT